MVIHYFNSKRMPIMPFEANSPLVVHSDAPLPTSIARQLNVQELMRTKKFKAVTGEVDFQNFRGKKISTLQLVEGKIVPK